MKVVSKGLLQSHERAGWAVIGVGFLGFFIWAALYPIDQGVPGTGYVVTETGKVAILSPTSGLLSSLNKRAGELVKQGEVIAEFDSTVLQARKRGLQEAISGVVATLKSLESARVSRQTQIDSIRTQHDSFKRLVETGFSTQNYLSTLQMQLSLAESEFFELQSSIDQTKFRLRELRESLVGIEAEISRMKIQSPMDGLLMNLAFNSPGLHVNQGSQLMEVASVSEALKIKVQIPINHASVVSEKMVVDVMFPSLPGSSTLRISGSLEYLSSDQIVDPKNGQSYLEGYVYIDNAKLKNLQIKAGVPASVLIRTGRRTMLSYITRPFTERLARGLQ